jgi:Tfp pilus assembly pilus retraction ATPase PilT
MHIANTKTHHLDCAQYADPDALNEALQQVLRGDPDVIVFHQLAPVAFDLARRAYESGVEVLVTPFPDRGVIHTTTGHRSA